MAIVSLAAIEDPDGNKIELAELNEESQTRQAAAKRRWLEQHGA